MKKIKKLLMFTTVIAMFVLCCVFSASAATSGKYTYEIQDGKAVITDVDESISGEVKIPSKLGGYTVTKIGGFAFEECKYIKSIIIPETISSIDIYAFSGCESLISCKLPSKLTKIEKGLFANCEQLESISIPKNVKTISDWSFFLCSSLTKIIIPDKVITIGENAFSYCNSVDKVSIGNSLVSIGAEAFSYCSGVTTINFPETLKTIGFKAFVYCESLESIDIPDKTTKIDDFAFAYCEALTEVNIGNSIPKINKGVFGYCENLDYIIIPNTVKSIEEFAFFSCDNLNEIYYEGHLDEWKTISIKKNNDSLFKASIIPSEFDSPSNFKGSSTDTSVTFKWLPVEGAYGYEVYVKSGKQWKLVKSVYNPQITVKNLKSGTKYTFAVKVFGRYPNGEIFYDNKYTSTYCATKPINIAKITAKQSTNSVTLTWSKVKCSGYRVYLKTSSGWKSLKTTTSTSYKVTDLKKGKKYTFAIRAYSKNGSYSVWSDKYTTITTATKCATPTLKVASTEKGKVVFSWSNVAGESGYQVYYSTKKDSGYKKVASYKTNVVKASKSKLTSKKTYYFKVRAYTKTASGTVYSAYSAVKSVKVK